LDNPANPRRPRHGRALGRMAELRGQSWWSAGPISDRLPARPDWKLFLAILRRGRCRFRQRDLLDLHRRPDRRSELEEALCVDRATMRERTRGVIRETTSAVPYCR